MAPNTDSPALDDDAVEKFRTEGYLELGPVLDADAVTALRHAVETAPERDPGPNPLTLDTMRFASNLFYGDERLQRFLCSDPIVGIVRALLGDDAWVRWDQAVWKGPGGPVFPWHQDNGYSALEAMHLQIWVALTPMDATNGGLLVSPGGHRRTEPHRWIGGHVEMDPPQHPVSISAAAGDAIAFSSFLPHATTANTTGADRLAYVAEFLPTAEPDRSVEPPHFVAVAGGMGAGRFEDLRATWEDRSPIDE